MQGMNSKRQKAAYLQAIASGEVKPEIFKPVIGGHFIQDTEGVFNFHSGPMKLPLPDSDIAGFVKNTLAPMFPDHQINYMVVL